MAELHRIPQDWYIVTSSSPDVTAGLTEALYNKYRLETVSANTYEAALKGTTPLSLDSSLVIFDRSGIDAKQDPEDIEVVDQFTINARGVFWVTPENALDRPLSEEFSLIRALKNAYARMGHPPVEITAENQVAQAEVIVEHINQITLEQMPTMGN